MCTSVTVKTKDQHHFLARNMDFYDLPIEYNVCIVPRNYRWLNEQEKQIVQNKYAIIGMSIFRNNRIGFFDGMNEHGLMGVVHYLEGFADFSPERDPEKYNISVFDFIHWVLSQYKSTAELVRNMDTINIMAQELDILETVPPLHWIFSDRQSETIVIESTKEGVKIYDNKVGAFSNSPDFKWHLINLNLYTGLSPQDRGEVYWGDYQINRSPELVSGSFGIPGDYSSPSRFVRAAYLRNHIESASNESEGLRNSMKVLEYCSVARGADIEDGAPSYTLYTSSMCSETGTYYYHSYENEQINAINLFKVDLNTTHIKKYRFLKDQSIRFQN